MSAKSIHHEAGNKNFHFSAITFTASTEISVKHILCSASAIHPPSKYKLLLVTNSFNENHNDLSEEELNFGLPYAIRHGKKFSPSGISSNEDTESSSTTGYEFTFLLRQEADNDENIDDNAMSIAKRLENLLEDEETDVSSALVDIRTILYTTNDIEKFIYHNNSDTIKECSFPVNFENSLESAGDFVTFLADMIKFPDNYSRDYFGGYFGEVDEENDKATIELEVWVNGLRGDEQGTFTIYYQPSTGILKDMSISFDNLPDAEFELPHKDYYVGKAYKRLWIDTFKTKLIDYVVIANCINDSFLQSAYVGIFEMTNDSASELQKMLNSEFGEGAILVVTKEEAKSLFAWNMIHDIPHIINNPQGRTLAKIY